MEDNTISKIAIEKMPETSVNSFPPVSAFKPLNTKKGPSKKAKLLIIVAIIMLITLTTLYFLNKRSVETAVPNLQERLDNSEEVMNKTKEIGLPDEKKQLELIKYNLQD